MYEYFKEASMAEYNSGDDGTGYNIYRSDETDYKIDYFCLLPINRLNQTESAIFIFIRVILRDLPPLPDFITSQQPKSGVAWQR